MMWRPATGASLAVKFDIQIIYRWFALPKGASIKDSPHERRGVTKKGTYGDMAEGGKT